MTNKTDMAKNLRSRVRKIFNTMMNEETENQTQTTQTESTHIPENESALPDGHNPDMGEHETPQVESAPVSAEEKWMKEANEWRDKYLRLSAEFDNSRKRHTKERIELLGSASADVIKELLPVLDDFDRAVKANETTENIEVVKEGFNLIHQKFYKKLESKGLKPVDATGKPFDTDFHEAITQIPAPSDDLKGKVVDELEKGYLLNDKVIRFSKVVIGQ